MLPKLFLLDAMALIYRSHFAFIKAPRITSTGLNTSAVFGFTNTLLDIIKNEKPTHLGVSFDTPKPTFRHIQFPEYKAQRQAQPEDITIAIPLVKKICEAMNIPLLLLDGYEADDVIGTLAKKAGKDGFRVFMMTPDKDYGQLVEENIFLYKPAYMGKGVEVMGVPEICERWQIENVGQLVDMLGLMGDAADNIPGLPGVGEKTAQKLIQEFGSIENIIANVDKLKGKLQETVQNHADKGILSKELATIDINVPIEFDAEALKISAPNREVLESLLDELEFRTLKKRILGDDSTPTKTAPVNALKATAGQQISLFDAAPPQQTASSISFFEEEEIENIPTKAPKDDINTTVHEYYLMDTPQLRQSLVHYLLQQSAIVFDTETTSTDANEADLVGLSFCYEAKEAFYVPIPENATEAQAILEEFRAVFENENISKIGQNIKYDLLILKNYGIEVAGELHDSMLAHYLIEPEQRHGMDFMAETILNYSPVSITELIGKKGKLQGTMREVQIHLVKEYAAEDADITWQLHHKLMPQLAKNQHEKLYKNVEIPLVRVLANMEHEGVRVDIGTLQDFSGILEKDIQEVQGQIFSLANQEFNIASPKQLGEVLFDKMKLDPKAKKTKTGQYATGEEILSKLEEDHEIARKILDFRELQKLKNTYVDALPLLINPKTGRIHTSYNQAVAATGRLSSTNPNLQNIPIRTPRGREIRKAFIPRNDDFKILSADYSQIELRIMAAFSGDESMIEAFNQGRDVHATTASKVFKVGLEDVTSEMRRKAKMVNFGIIYGISPFGLAQRLKISRTEAKEMIDAYWVEFPKVRTYMDKCINDARDMKYAETILGRRRYLANIDSHNMTDRSFAERNAINAPIQGSAADILKVAMIHVDTFMQAEKLKSKMILTVHDELVFDAHYSEIDYLKTRIDELMANAIPLAVKLETGIGVGMNWLEAH